MRSALVAALIVVAIPAAAQQATDSAAFVTVLGRDTLAVERWIEFGPNRFEAEVAVRSPRTTLRRGILIIDPDGSTGRWEEHWLDPLAPERGPTRVEVSLPADSGWTRRVTSGDSARTVALAGPGDALPWADLVHWPFQVAAARVPASGALQLPFLAGQRPLVMTLQRTAPGEMTITHPLRGPTLARVDARGRIVSMDAASTTRKVIVTRVPWVDTRSLARAWAAADQAGRGVGELSGRAHEDATVAGAQIAVDYGTPMRRGREIFGTVVRYGEVWRTGANRATHFTTSDTLMVGDPARGAFLLPAGEYTLFSVPERDGGWLIVNRQTGQTGTAYDRARDAGRVALSRREVAEPVERFTIRVAPLEGRRGEIVIAWDRSEFFVPFEVR